MAIMCLKKYKVHGTCTSELTLMKMNKTDEN